MPKRPRADHRRPARARPPMAGREASRNECKAAVAATLQTVRRVRVIAVAVLAALAVAAVAAIAARDAVYWEKPLPGVALSEVDLEPDDPGRRGRRDLRRPAQRGADGRRSGHASRARSRRSRLVPPPCPAARRSEPAGARSRPGARAAAGRRGPRQAALARAAEAPSRPGRHPRRVVLDHSVAARRRCRRQHPGRRAREGGTYRRANALARI